MRAEIDRRRFLCLGTLCAFGAGSVLMSRMAIGAQGIANPQTAWALSNADFTSTSLYQALASLGTVAPVPEDPRLRLDAPDRIEDGGRVPVSIQCAIEEVDAIALLAVANPFPLVATFRILPGTLPTIAVRIKLQTSGAVIALARTPQGFRSVSRELQVISGGCT